MNSCCNEYAFENEVYGWYCNEDGWISTYCKDIGRELKKLIEDEEALLLKFSRLYTNYCLFAA